MIRENVPLKTPLHTYTHADQPHSLPSTFYYLYCLPGNNVLEICLSSSSLANHRSQGKLHDSLVVTSTMSTDWRYHPAPGYRLSCQMQTFERSPKLCIVYENTSTHFLSNLFEGFVSESFKWSSFDSP